ncbi:MAG: hypothetical protein FJ100_18185 [Deltaproteobacteria bacterium]|nr:hypothetical protein [Deltaproteobacteria bacterium]
MPSPHPALDLLPRLDPALALDDLDWAIGGAAAMALHGYSRHTDDLDVFFHGDDGNRVLHALRRAGVVFATIADPYHYAIFPDLTHPDRRIDLLFAWDDAESDAIAFPDERVVEVAGVQRSVKYFPILLLVACKLQSSRPRDHDDVARMYERGLFDPGQAQVILDRLGGDPDALERLARIRSGSAMTPAGRRQRGR